MVGQSWSSAWVTLSVILCTASAETFSVAWDSTPKDPLSVNVGDTVDFIWDSGLHDVHIYPTLSCNETSSNGTIPEAIYEPATEGGFASYTFFEEDALEGDMFFASNVDGDCENNVNVLVAVFPADTPSPTPAPSVATDQPTAANVTTSAPTMVASQSPTEKEPIFGEAADVQMTLWAITDMTEDEQEEWATLTVMYEEDFYTQLGYEFTTEIDVGSIEPVESTEERRMLQENQTEGVLISYSQKFWYLIPDGLENNLDLETPEDWVTTPFAEEELREVYVSEYLNKPPTGGSVLEDVASVSAVTVADPTRPPSGDDDDGLSGGAIAGIIIAVLVVVVFAVGYGVSTQRKAPMDDQQVGYHPPTHAVLPAEGEKVEGTYSNGNDAASTEMNA